MLTHAFSQAKHQWDEINKLPTRGAGKVHKKQLFLFAWQDELKETGKNFGPLFWEEMESLGITDTHSLEGTWVTAGRLASFVGAQEAREMISGGELRTKKINMVAAYFSSVRRSSRALRRGSGRGARREPKSSQLRSTTRAKSTLRARRCLGCMHA